MDKLRVLITREQIAQKVKEIAERITHDFAGESVILIGGLTLTYLKNILLARQPKSLKIAVLLDKVPRRLQPIHVDYVGFEIPDEFVVGYGLDYAERYRNLPDVCVLESDSKPE